MGIWNRESSHYWFTPPLIMINGNFEEKKTAELSVFVSRFDDITSLVYVSFFFCSEEDWMFQSMWRSVETACFLILWKYVLTAFAVNTYFIYIFCFAFQSSVNSWYNVGTKPANKQGHYFFLHVFTLPPWWGSGDWYSLNHLNKIGTRFSLQKYWQNVSLVASPEVI